VTEALRVLAPGHRLSVRTDKWSVVRDLEAYAHATGHRYRGWREDPEAPETWWVELEAGPARPSGSA
jgi:TusA-related sulfurtransferase